MSDVTWGETASCFLHGDFDANLRRCPECAPHTPQGFAADGGPDYGDDSGPVLGKCEHGVDLDREFCPKGCRV